MTNREIIDLLNATFNKYLIKPSFNNNVMLLCSGFLFLWSQ